MCKDPAGQQVNDTGTAGVIARPPLLFVAALLLGLASDYLLPFPFAVPETDLVRWIIASFLIFIGLAFAAAGIRRPGRHVRQCRNGAALASSAVTNSVE